MGVFSEANDHCSNDFSVVHRPCRELGTLPVQRLGALPPPLAGEGWGGGELARVLLRVPPPPPPPPRGGGGGGGVSLHESCCVPPPCPSPAGGGGDPLAQMMASSSSNSVAGHSTTEMRVGTVRQNRAPSIDRRRFR